VGGKRRKLLIQEGCGMPAEKMDGNSLDVRQQLLAVLKNETPQVFAEGKIDSAKLAATLGQDISGDKERYGLSWAGKNDCFRHIQEPTTATLKPIRKESTDFDTTENIFIEGDNLQVLKVLQKSYYGKVKMIYIDPPYNTGSDSFIYPDRFQETQDEYLKRIGDKDTEGNLIRDGFWRKNNKDAGHFHSNWLSMMYPRLFLARNLLRQDGVIFVSIDDNEVHNLRMIMNEVYGEENFIACIAWEKRYTRSNNAKMFTSVKDTIFAYRKHEMTVILKEPRTAKTDSIYSNPDNDPRGPWTSVSYINPATKDQRPNLVYPITNPFNKKKVIHPTNAWKFQKSEYEKQYKEKKVWWGMDGKYEYPRLKKFLSEVSGGVVPVDLWNHKETGTTDEGSKECEELIGKDIFDNPKPTRLLRRMLQIQTDSLENDIVLDFFAGSCTTAHAVMKLNAEDGGNRKFICVQLPEPCEEESEAFKAGFATIADIGKERIRRAAKKIADENKGKLDFDGGKLDLGFKVFRLEESNFKEWRTANKTAAELEKQLTLFVNNVKDGTNQEDILYELILKAGQDLNVSVEAKKANGKNYYKLDGGKLIVCLEEKITQGLVDKILAEKAEKFICLDRAFAGNDQLKTNTALQMEAEKVEFKVI
jgi:adenine-specific DNA-methyltransferase